MIVMVFSAKEVSAATQQQVKEFFNSYVVAANNFDKNMFSKYYISNPKLIRVVQKKDGTTQSVTIPKSIYLEEAAKGRFMAKTINYKNNYTNIVITTQGKDFKVSAIRKPSPGGSYPAYFIIGEVNGVLKIKEESMNTPRTEFLKK